MSITLKSLNVKYLNDITVEVIDHSPNPLFYNDVEKVYCAYRQCYSTEPTKLYELQGDAERQALKQGYLAYVNDLILGPRFIDLKALSAEHPLNDFARCKSQDDINYQFPVYWSHLVIALGQSGIHPELELSADMDELLLRYLGMCKFISKIKLHQSPLEHASVTVRITNVSRSASHQLVRHRIASYSQASQRYIDMSNPPLVIPPSIANNPEAKELYINSLQAIPDLYSKLIRLGIPKEDARYILPNATTTELVMTMNWREFTHFCGERCCSRAQAEIRVVANKIRSILRTIPWIFDDLGPKCYRLGYCPEHKGCGRMPTRQ